MKSLNEKINWYRETEDRKWKRIWHCVELFSISMSAAVMIIVIQLYGDGTKLQPVFMVFTGLLALSSVCLVPSFSNDSVFKRWHIQLIKLGLGCGVGVSAVAALVILELQHVSS